MMVSSGYSMRFKSLIFDFDGLLADSKELYVQVIWNALKTLVITAKKKSQCG